MSRSQSSVAVVVDVRDDGGVMPSSLRSASLGGAAAAAVQLGSSSSQWGRRELDRHPLELRRVLNDDEAVRNDLAYCLSFAVNDSEFSRNFPQLFADSRMTRQLEISTDQLRRKDRPSSNVLGRSDDAPLPRTVRDALRPTRRATVITEAVAPFRIVDVNVAWEELCGYTFVESKGKTLGSLLKGPDTDQVAATALISKLLEGEPEAGTTLVNYTKSGRRFRNRVRVGPLVESDSGNASDRADEAAHVKYFVGVLQEVHIP